MPDQRDLTRGEIEDAIELWEGVESNPHASPLQVDYLRVLRQLLATMDKMIKTEIQLQAAKREADAMDSLAISEREKGNAESDLRMDVTKRLIRMTSERDAALERLELLEAVHDGVMAALGWGGRTRDKHDADRLVQAVVEMRNEAAQRDAAETGKAEREKR